MKMCVCVCPPSGGHQKAKQPAPDTNYIFRKIIFQKLKTSQSNSISVLMMTLHILAFPQVIFFLPFFSLLKKCCVMHNNFHWLKRIVLRTENMIRILNFWVSFFFLVKQPRCISQPREPMSILQRVFFSPACLHTSRSYSALLTFCCCYPDGKYFSSSKHIFTSMTLLSNEEHRQQAPHKNKGSPLWVIPEVAAVSPLWSTWPLPISEVVKLERCGDASTAEASV